MCQTTAIHQNVTRLSRRAYNHRLDAVDKTNYHATQLARLNADLHKLYVSLYEQYPTITEADYEVFGGQLSLLIGTLKGLVSSCQHLPKSLEISEETASLKRNYMLLSEINHDLAAFRVALPHDREMQDLMEQASLLLQA